MGLLNVIVIHSYDSYDTFIISVNYLRCRPRLSLQIVNINITVTGRIKSYNTSKRMNTYTNIGTVHIERTCFKLSPLSIKRVSAALLFSARVNNTSSADKPFP